MLKHTVGSRPVYGLIFLFKWQQEAHKQASHTPADATAPSSLFFAKQVVTNACATQAIVSVLFNRSEIQMGQQLSAVKEFCKGFGPEFCGKTTVCLSSSVCPCQGLWAAYCPILCANGPGACMGWMEFRRAAPVIALQELAYPHPLILISNRCSVFGSSVMCQPYQRFTSLMP